MILVDLKSSFADLDLRPGAPARNESRRRRGVEEIDRDRIVDDTAQSGGVIA
jgi:hypothetical protein